MTTKVSREVIWNFPKADLHRHLDGAIKPEVLFRLAKQTGVKLPTDDPEKFKGLYQIIKPKGMPIEDLFKRFAWAIAVMRTPEGLEEVAYQQVLDLAQENIKYAEIRFAPGYHSTYPAPWYKPSEYESKLFPVMSLRHVAGHVLNGLDQGMKETGIEVNLTLCIPRESLALYGSVCVDEVIRLATEFKGEGVMAVDLCSDEYTYPPGPYVGWFAKLRQRGLYSDPHAGEMGHDEYRLQNIRTCLEEFRADGLGHALPIWKSEYLMEKVRQRNIRIERTPLSPVPGCSLADGHLGVLLENRVPVTIASDDPILMQASLTKNIGAALDYHNFGERELHILTANAVNTGFYRNEAQKMRVRELFTKDGLDPQLLR